jgi:hypothetical protein
MCIDTCSCMFSKLKELSKRTTFIRVTQQINEVFGSAPPATHSSQLPPASVSLGGGAPASLPCCPPEDDGAAPGSS